MSIRSLDVEAALSAHCRRPLDVEASSEQDKVRNNRFSIINKKLPANGTDVEDVIASHFCRIVRAPAAASDALMPRA